MLFHLGSKNRPKNTQESVVTEKNITSGLDPSQECPKPKASTQFFNVTQIQHALSNNRSYPNFMAISMLFQWTYGFLPFKF
jgi:hypothetical protein